MIRVSVLVPIYNVEEFLPQCLDSLVGQTLKEIEIICINDGSTDGSLEVIQDYATRDKRIKIIDKKNSGYGDSMNVGLEKARGEYVGIVEPDDFAALNMFEKLYKMAKKYDCDVVKSNYFRYYGEKKRDIGRSNLFLPTEVNRVLDPRVYMNIIYQEPCIWAAIYKRDFLRDNEIDFLPTPGASYQDTGFNFKVWVSAERVYYLEDALLHYRQDNAKSSVKDSKKVYYIVQEYDEGKKYLKARNQWNRFGKIWFMCKMRGYVWNLHRMSFRLAMKFANVVRSDYLSGKSRGFLRDTDLTRQNKKYLVAAHYPRIYVLMRPVQDFISWIKKIILVKSNK